MHPVSWSTSGILLYTPFLFAINHLYSAPLVPSSALSGTPKQSFYSKHSLTADLLPTCVCAARSPEKQFLELASAIGYVRNDLVIASVPLTSPGQPRRRGGTTLIDGTTTAVNPPALRSFRSFA